MHRTRTAGLLLAATTAALLAGAGTAAAAEPTPPDQPPVTITLSPEQSERVCAVRVPELLERLAELEERIGGSAAVVGSTAWLTERVEAAEAAGRSEQAERLRERLDRRAELPDRIDGLQADVEAFRDAQCAA